MKGKNQVVVADVPVPSIRDGEILVKMRVSGVCGTDLEKIRGNFFTPPVLGHEVAGVVEQVGPGVRRLQVGDRVAVHHHVPCHKCYYCRRGDFTMCEEYPRSNLDPGGFAEYFRVPAVNVRLGAVFSLPKSVSFEEGSMLEPIGCGVKALGKAGFHQGESALVIGAGPSGLTLLMLLRAFRARRVLVSDPVETRLRVAARLGASRVVNPLLEDLEQVAKDENQGVGPDLVVVAVGSTKAIDSGLRAVRKGGRVLLFGIPHVGDRLGYDVSQLFIRETAVLASYSTSEKDMRRALSLLSADRIDLTDIISHRFKLTRFQEAIECASNPERSVKVLITD